jgi:hypothetical protein
MTSQKFFSFLLTVKRNLQFTIPVFILFLFSIVTLNGCTDEPTDLGLNFLDPDDTTGVRTLDSQTDTLTITGTNYKYRINTLGSRGILVGRYQDAEANSMIKFTGISDQYAGATVNSAILKLTFRGYSYQDLNGITSFDIFRVNKNFNYQTVTFDSVSSADIGTNVLGSYTGTLTDTTTIEITLDNQTVKDWLEAAADPEYQNPNYGIYLKATGSSTTIKSFFSIAQGGSLIPNVLVVLTNNNETDTITLVTPESVSLCDAPIPAFNERFITQNGIAIRNMLRFDLSKLPENVVINNAQLEFYIDRSQSYITGDSEMRMIIGMITDSTNKTDSTFGSLNNAFIQQDSLQFITTISNIVQRWNSGLSPNLGISIRGASEIQNLDRFIFYDVDSSDINRRPRLKIVYTQRI